MATKLTVDHILHYADSDLEQTWWKLGRDSKKFENYWIISITSRADQKEADRYVKLINFFFFQINFLIL